MRMSFENSGGYRREMGMMMDMGNEQNEAFDRKAPEGMFRVVGRHTLSQKAWLFGDFYPDEEEKLFEHVNKNHGDFVEICVYDDNGQEINKTNLIRQRYIN